MHPNKLQNNTPTCISIKIAKLQFLNVVLKSLYFIFFQYKNTMFNVTLCLTDVGTPAKVGPFCYYPAYNQQQHLTGIFL